MSLVETMLRALGPWSWHVLGLLLLGLEIVAPSTFFLWFGLAALAVGTLALFIDLGWQTEILLFLGLAVVSLVVGRRLMRGSGRAGDEFGDPTLNRRGDRYVGREFVLREPISGGTGRLSVDDTVWRVRGPDLAAGTPVRVLSVDGAVLVVEGLSGPQAN